MHESYAFEAFAQATPKQREALELAAEGFTSKQIAAELGIAPRTADQRIDALRQHLDGIPRNDLVRLYRSWREICDRTTYGPIPLSPRTAQWPEAEVQREPDLVFHDSLAVDGRMGWEQRRNPMWPGLRPSDLGTGGKLAAVFAAAMLLLMCFALIVATAQGVSALATRFAGS